jgi:hypothetical protein
MAAISIVFGVVVSPGLLIAMLWSTDLIHAMRWQATDLFIIRNSWWMLGVAPVEATAVMLVLLFTTRDERVRACAATLAAAVVLGLFLTVVVAFRPPLWRC